MLEESRINSLLWTLFTCIESKYVDWTYIESWMRTIDPQLLVSEFWLLELTTCQSLAQVQDILIEKIQKEHLVFDDKYATLVGGFLYLGYLEGKISFNEFEIEFVDLLDSYGFSGVDIEQYQCDPRSSDGKIDKDSPLSLSLDKSAELCRLAFMSLRDWEGRGQV